MLSIYQSFQPSPTSPTLKSKIISSRIFINGSKTCPNLPQLPTLPSHIDESSNFLSPQCFCGFNDSAESTEANPSINWHTSKKSYYTSAWSG